VTLFAGHEDTLVLARRATVNKSIEYGVKGFSPLVLLPDFDLISGFIPDYMHCVCLEVVHQFLSLGTDGANSNSHFYLDKHKRDMLDAFLDSIRPPREVRRLPRSTQEAKFWKATEWRSF
jgi:hypothetical protein